MNIDYKTTLDVKGQPAKFTEVIRNECCDPIDKAFESELMSFGQDEDEKPFLGVSIQWDESGYYGDRTTHREPIDFCPFCGAKIMFSEVERVKIVETRTPVVKTVRSEDVVRREEVVWKKTEEDVG